MNQKYDIQWLAETCARISVHAIPITLMGENFVGVARFIYIMMVLAIGVIAMAITNGWGIIAFALLLPTGIVALREKDVVPKHI